MPDVALLLLGLVAILAGAELLVRCASRLAARLNVSPMVIGLTVVSIGTSAPELAIGVDAALRDAGPLAVGNVAGTNILTLLLIVGVAALIRPLTVRLATVRLDLPVLVTVCVAVALLAMDGRLGWLEGGVLVALGVGYTIVLVLFTRRESRARQREFAAEFGAPSPRERRPGAVLLDIGGLVGGIAVVVLAADWLVNGAVGIAGTLGVPEDVIGLTIVAIGTSAPELTTTIVATIRGERDVAVGNLLGSSIYNVVLILGVTLLIADPDVLLEPGLRIDLGLMALAAIVCIPVFFTGARVRRLEGAALVVAYLGYLTWLLLTRT